MVGKGFEFDDEAWAAINLMRQERRRSFQQLADDAFADLLAKQSTSLTCGPLSDLCASRCLI